VWGEVGCWGPAVVITKGIVIGAAEPLLISQWLRLPGCPLVVIHDHRGEKRRLRTREVVSSIRVEDGAVVLDLEEEVLDHIASELEHAVLHEAANDEVAVPAVHFV